MGRNTKNRFPKSKMKEPGTFFPERMLMSRAFWALGGRAQGGLIYFLRKRDMKPDGNGGYRCVNARKISVTYKELQNLFNNGRIEPDQKFDGLSKKQVEKILDELLAKGFIEVVYQGGNIVGDRTIYGLTDDWQEWTKGKVFRTRNKRVIQKCFCVPKLPA